MLHVDSHVGVKIFALAEGRSLGSIRREGVASFLKESKTGDERVSIERFLSTVGSHCVDVRRCVTISRGL